MFKTHRGIMGKSLTIEVDGRGWHIDIRRNDGKSDALFSTSEANGIAIPQLRKFANGTGKWRLASDDFGRTMGYEEYISIGTEYTVHLVWQIKNTALTKERVLTEFEQVII